MSNLTKHMLNFLLFSFGKTKPIIGPIRVHWDITELCNSRCKHCTRWKLKNSKNDLSTKEAMRVMRELKEVGVRSISFSGNEPLMRRNIYDLVKYANSLKIFTSINTNGILLNKKNTETLIRNGIGTFIFSLDSSNKKDHDFIRGVSGSFDKIFECVSLIKKIRKEDGKKVDIQVTTVANRKNVKQLYDIVKLCKEKGFDKIIIQPIHHIKKYFESEESLLLRKEDVAEMQKQIDKIKKDFEDFVAVPNQYLDNFKTFIENPNEMYKYRCTAFFITGDIRSNGDVVPCPVGFRKLGNLKEKSFKEIWYSKEATKLRLDIKNNKHPMCWFSCIQPINLIADNVKRLNIFGLLNIKFLKHAFSKIK